EDGPSQMGLEDLAMFRAVPGSVVLYPADAVSTERCVELAAGHRGIVYIRTTRPKTPVVYGPDEPFAIGALKVVRQAGTDRDAVLEAVAAEGIRVRKLAVVELPRSGAPEALLDRCGISARHIVRTVLEVAGAS